MSVVDAAYDAVMMARLRQTGQAHANTVAVANAEIAKAQRVVDELRARISQLEIDMKLVEAANAAAGAQVKALRAQHPQSPLLADSGHRSADGKAKSKLVVLWENTFDAALRKAGIANPERYRE